MRIVSVEPTVFFVRDGDILRQLVQVTLDNKGGDREARLEVRADGLEEALPLGVVASGTAAYEAYLPDIREPKEVWLGLWAGDTLRDERTLDWEPQKHWKVYLIQYAHHDLGYTDLPSNVIEEYDGFMDQVLGFCEETENWPQDDARFRYLCEQAWSVVHYVENRPKEVVERLAHFMRNGQIEVTALFGNQTLELCGHEELVRLLYPSFRFKREYGIEISSAEHNDVPGFPWGLASVLAGAGVRYFSPGVPFWYFGRGEDRVHPLWDMEEALTLETPAACWWEGPDGSRVLLWSDFHGYGEWQPYNYDEAVTRLPGMLGGLDERGYPYDMVSYTLRGGHRDNAPPSLRYAYIVREWNSRWAYPHLVNTTNKPFLEAFERRYGNTLKTLRGDVPGTDYPVAATCTPKETAVDRNAHDWLMTAEKLATLASLFADYEYPRAVIDKAYRETFTYDLHCWGLSHVGGPAQDAHWSENGDRAYRAAALAHDVMLKAANKLVDEITCPEDAFYFTVFNPLSYERTDLVRVPLRPWGSCSMPMHWRDPVDAHPWPSHVSGRAIGRGVVDPPASLLAQPFKLIDAGTGESVIYQVAEVTDPQAASPWAAERVAMGKFEKGTDHTHDIVFVAEGLPPMGYKTYRIVPCEEWPKFAIQFTATDTTIENRFYRLALDAESGAIASLHDNELGRELVDENAPHGFGQMIIRSSETAEEELARISEAKLVEAGPVFATLRLRGATSCCPRVTQEITLYNGLKRVDFNARILRDSTPMVEVYFAFPFHVDDPQFRFEAANAVTEPTRDQWPGSNTDYYAVQHWADVFGDEGGVVWTAVDTPIAEFGGLWPGYMSSAHHGVRGPGYGHPFLRPGELDRGYIYSLVSYNNFRTNFINVHPGEFLVRYAFGSHEGDWREGRASEFGWSAANPPLAVWMKGPRTGGSLPPTASFCQVDAPNVLVLTLKKAEDGNGYILRMVETEGKATKVKVTVPHVQLLHVFETNLVEENQRILPVAGHTVETAVGPFALATIRLAAEL